MAATAAAALLAASCAWPRASCSQEAAPLPLPDADQAVAKKEGPPAAAELNGESTLAQWKLAASSDRSKLAVALARKRLATDATKLEIAKTAMEISGCLTTTARDPRFDAWTLAPTAATCLTAPERPAK